MWATEPGQSVCVGGDTGVIYRLLFLVHPAAFIQVAVDQTGIQLLRGQKRFRQQQVLRKKPLLPKKEGRTAALITKEVFW